MNIRTTLTVAAVSLGLTLAGATAASAAGPDDAQRAGQGGPAAGTVCELTGEPADQVRDRLQTADGTCDADGDGLCDVTGEPADQVRDQLRAADGTGTGRQTRQHAQLAV